MYSPWMVESMEIIAGSILAAVVYGTAVMSFAATVAYLLTREHAAAPAAATNVVRGTDVVHEPDFVGVPPALAG